MVERKQGLTPPRIGTPRSKLPSLGWIASLVGVNLGTPFVPWQELAAEVSMEVVTKGRPRFASRQVGVQVPRQCGKSTLAGARAVAQCLLPEMDHGLDIRIAPQHVGWLAQDRLHATRSWRELVDRIVYSSEYNRRVRKPRNNPGEECLTFVNGSTLRPITPNRVGPRGLSLDLIVLDEAMAHDVGLLASLAPTQAQRDNHLGSIGAQFFVASTAGDERSTLFNRLTDLGRAAVETGDRSRCWLDWSAEPDCDVYDPKTWRMCIPTLDRPGGITTEFIRDQAEAMSLEDFRREFLCLLTSRPAAQIIDQAAWAQAPQDVPGGKVVFAVDATPSGSMAALVAAGTAGSATAIEVIAHNPGVSWLVAATVDKALRWNAPVAIDSTGPTAWIIPELVRADVEVIKINGADSRNAAAAFAAAVTDGRIAHQRDQRLDYAVEVATGRKSGDRWRFDRQSADLSVLIAASLAAWALDSAQVLQAQVW